MAYERKYVRKYKIQKEDPKGITKKILDDLDREYNIQFEQHLAQD